MLKIGHRGWRGNFPENSIIGIREAIAIGVDGIEIDVVVNGNSEVVVSHEPWMNPEICTPAGVQHNIYKLSQAEIEQYDCGSKIHPDFPFQKGIRCSKPLLTDVLRIVPPSIQLFIEIKSAPEGDKKFHPEPEQYVRLITCELDDLHTNNFYLMSFDQRIISEIKNHTPDIQTIYLFEEKPKNLPVTDCVGPFHQLVSPEFVARYKQNGYKVFTWTVNELKDIERCVESEVDGMISDYPNRLFF